MPEDPFPVTRRDFLKTGGAAAASWAVQGNAKASSSGKVREKGPNIVFLLADQLRVQSCGYAGETRAHTPRIDELAEKGISFGQAVSAMPVCSAFRATLFTGKHTTSTGMVINELRLSPDHRCLGHCLTDAGYRTGYIGKWHLWANQLGNHRDPKNGFVPPGPYRLGFDGTWAGYNFNHQYYDAYYFEDTPDRVTVEGYEPDVQTDLALRFLQDAGQGEEPFALFLSYGTPHDPWGPDNVPEEDWKRFEDISFPHPLNYSPENDPYADGWARIKEEDRARLEAWRRGYFAMNASMDRNIGRILDALDKQGLADNTLVVFTSDHGEMFGAHGRRAKNIFYEEACRIPFLLRWPGHIAPGTASDACLGSPDIMPTLLGLLGIPVPSEVEGVDLSDAALGKSKGEERSAFLQNTGACAAWEDGHEWRALRDARFTYAVYRVDRRELLFDNQEDPYQLRDLSQEKSSRRVLKRLRKELKERMAEIEDTFETCNWYREHWTRDRVILRGARGGTHDLKQMEEILQQYWG